MDWKSLWPRGYKAVQQGISFITHMLVHDPGLVVIAPEKVQCWHEDRLGHFSPACWLGLLQASFEGTNVTKVLLPPTLTLALILSILKPSSLLWNHAGLFRRLLVPCLAAPLVVVDR